jgi:hypothetical protein
MARIDWRLKQADFGNRVTVTATDLETGRGGSFELNMADVMDRGHALGFAIRNAQRSIRRRLGWQPPGASRT